MIDSDLISRIVSTGSGLGYEETASLGNTAATWELLEAAGKVTRAFSSRRFDSCSIINAKSGRCPEDCKWCAQSARYDTGARVYPMLSPEEMFAAAVKCHEKGIRRFSFVTSGRKLSDRDVDIICETAVMIAEKCPIDLCISAGLSDHAQLQRLRKAGITRYHCNLETAPSYFGKLCTTHTQDEKVKVLKDASAAGMDVCSGGIIGMGETMEQRIEMACRLAELGVKSVPVNILSPIKGTPLERVPLISEDEILRTIALFRLILPDARLRFAGGKARLSERTLHAAYSSCIDASIMGDMLTTAGADIDRDIELIKSAGYEF